MEETSATAEPDMPPKNILAKQFTWAKPPRIRPTMRLEKGSAVGIFLLDHKAARIGTEGSHEVIVAVSDDVKLGVAVDSGDRIHDDRRNLDSHPHVERSIPGMDAVFIDQLSHHACSYPAQGQKGTLRLYRCPIGQPDAPTSSVFDDQVGKP